MKAWESKNAKNAAKAGGISLMALSLAACGGSSTTTTTTTTTDTAAEAAAAEAAAATAAAALAPQTIALTIGVDAATGGDGDDTINGNSIANEHVGMVNAPAGGQAGAAQAHWRFVPRCLNSSAAPQSLAPRPPCHIGRPVGFGSEVGCCA